MQIDIDFEGALARNLAPEAMAPILDKALKSALTSAIDDATGWKSEFQKTLKEQLAQALPHGLRDSDLVKFQHVLNEALRGFVNGANAAAIETAMKKAIGQVMPEVPPVIKLSKFMETVRGGLHKEPNEPFYAYMERSHGTTYICLDSDPSPGDASHSRRRGREDVQYSAACRLAVGAEGWVYALKLKGTDITPASVPDVIGAFETALMGMYVGRTRLEIDMDDGDLESLSAEQYD